MRVRTSVWLCTLLLLTACAIALPSGAAAELASEPASVAAGRLDGGGYHTCALPASNGVRCWGFSANGQLGYGSTSTIGDDETPGSAGPVDLGRSAVALAASDFHTCALLDDGSVRCWGLGGDGQLGYKNTNTIGDNETPASVGPAVDLGRPAKAITAGQYHTCAILDNGKVRCWGLGQDGQLGYKNTNTIGDDETPASVGPVDLGTDREAVAISAAGRRTCAVLDNGRVLCWGYGLDGGLGYRNRKTIGDDETPASVGPIDLGPGKATAISVGGRHICAVLDGNVRCWGYGFYGQLGYSNTTFIGDDEAPGLVGPVDLGGPAQAITAGDFHSCAVLDGGSVRCWGYGGEGRLGYGNASNIGEDEVPGSVGPVDLGAGRRAVAISAGGRHTCAVLDDGSVLCWGYGGQGRLGYCNTNSVGDDEAPASAGPVGLDAAGTGCAASGGDAGTAVTPPEDGSQGSGDGPVAQPPASPVRRPGPIRKLKARAVSMTKIKLSFRAAGTDGSRAARSYLVRQSRRPIQTTREFARAQTLCKGNCRFRVSSVGAKLILTVTDLRPGTTYYYAVAARDKASKRIGPRSKTVKASTSKATRGRQKPGRQRR